MTEMWPLVDPTPIFDAELDRAKRELLAAAEQDMSLPRRIRFRLRLWKLRRRLHDMRYWIARW